MFPLVFHCKSGPFENHSTSNIVFSTYAPRNKHIKNAWLDEIKINS